MAQPSLNDRSALETLTGENVTSLNAPTLISTHLLFIMTHMMTLRIGMDIKIDAVAWSIATGWPRAFLLFIETQWAIHHTVDGTVNNT
jgi:hypothetical protein